MAQFEAFQGFCWCLGNVNGHLEDVHLTFKVENLFLHFLFPRCLVVHLCWIARL